MDLIKSFIFMIGAVIFATVAMSYIGFAIGAVLVAASGPVLIGEGISELGAAKAFAWIFAILSNLFIVGIMVKSPSIHREGKYNDRP